MGHKTGWLGNKYSFNLLPKTTANHSQWIPAKWTDIMAIFEERKICLQVWLCCWVIGLLCSLSDAGQGSFRQAGPFPCAQTSQLTLAMTLQYIVAGHRLGNDLPVHRLGNDAPTPWLHHARNSPGRPSCPGVLGHLLAASLASERYRWLLGDASAERQYKHMLVSLGWSRQGLAERKSLPVFLFPCKNFSPMSYSQILASAEPQWNCTVFFYGIQDKKGIKLYITARRVTKRTPNPGCHLNRGCSVP